MIYIFNVTRCLLILVCGMVLRMTESPPPLPPHGAEYRPPVPPHRNVGVTANNKVGISKQLAFLPTNLKHKSQ